MDRRTWLGGAGGLVTSAAFAQTPSASATVILTTPAGAIHIALSAAAPLTAANFLRYVDARRYDGASFYRAARAGSAEAGLVEAGLQGTRVPFFPPVAHESTTLTGLVHGDGAVSLARDAPGTGTSEFFICAGPAPYLDARPEAGGDVGYAVFGQVVTGTDVVRTILGGSTNAPAPTPTMAGQMLDAPVRILTARRVTVG